MFQRVCIMNCKLGEVSVMRFMVWDGVLHCNRENVVPYGADDSVLDGPQALHNHLSGVTSWVRRCEELINGSEEDCKRHMERFVALLQGTYEVITKFLYLLNFCKEFRV